ncbi:hypothetical protein [Thioalkalivibrio sp. ALJ16]|uniref:hypothetical protein n=1 Tax=Thioalkalivibrio sp. ALJ16 TaxID=1158762 RepID=UPI000570D1F3|nr:hypothetical protein [Thioalkalivibrio sp. ALJ16]
MDVPSRHTIEVLLEAVEKRTADSLGAQFLHDLQPIQVPVGEEPAEIRIKRDGDHIAIIFHFRDRSHVDNFKKQLSLQSALLRNQLASASSSKKKQIRRSLKNMTIDGLSPGKDYIMDQPFSPKPQNARKSVNVEDPKIRFSIKANLIPSSRMLPLASARNIRTTVTGLQAELPFGIAPNGRRTLEWLMPAEEIQVLESVRDALNDVLIDLRKEQTQPPDH